MTQETDGQREARERGWTGAAAVEFAKHWDAGGQQAVRENRALIAEAFHGPRCQPQPTLPESSAVYARRQVRATRGEQPLNDAIANPEAVYARRKCRL
jgi:hypothetical protein